MPIRVIRVLIFPSVPDPLRQSLFWHLDSLNFSIDGHTEKCNHEAINDNMLTEKRGGYVIRTQIQLSEEQARMLKELSLSSRESVAALIRKAVDQFLIAGKPDRSVLYRQAGLIVGKYKAEKSDIAVQHDRYLEEAFGS